MPIKRSSGILLHPTSLPGPHGIGELGQAAFAWIDWLAGSGCAYWQVLPLGPTGYGDSPYQCFSAFAGNPYLISLEKLLEQGLLTPEDLNDEPAFDPNRVDFGMIYEWKLAVLGRAYNRFVKLDDPQSTKSLAVYEQKMKSWLADFSLFMALKEAHLGRPWYEWSAELRRRDTKTLKNARLIHADAIRKHVFWQFLFWPQWNDVREYAHRKGVQLIGDVPIFAAYDSADVWANPELFYIDEQGALTVQAGVPPDYFSDTGQLWGNPLYRWDVHRERKYTWWIERLRTVLGHVDIVRLDHFRGFHDYWEIPAGAPNAVQGRWVLGPGKEFFEQIQAGLGGLPIIAEDLGELNPKVFELRDQIGLPGMKVLVFAFGEGLDNPFLPHNYGENTVVYTGTHDNDTTRGWYNRISERERDFARRYLARDGTDIAWDLLRLAWSSVAILAVAPLQDVLDLDNRARMNAPGTLGAHNWSWRYTENQLTDELQQQVLATNHFFGRLSG